MTLYTLLDAVLLVELVNTAAGVDQLLLAGVERVALGADFNGDVFAGGAGGNNVAAGALYSGLIILGMYAFLHVVHLFVSCLEYALHGYKAQMVL